MKSLPKISLLALMGLSVIISILFFVGGNEVDPIMSGGDALDVPSYTNTLLNWSYALIGLSLLVLLIGVAFEMKKNFEIDSKKAIQSVVAFLAVMGLLVISYALGSGDELKIVGYEGTENQGVWSKVTDMCIYSSYVLLIGGIVAIFGTSIYKMIKK